MRMAKKRVGGWILGPAHLERPGEWHWVAGYAPEDPERGRSWRTDCGLHIREGPTERLEPRAYRDSLAPTCRLCLEVVRKVGT